MLWANCRRNNKNAGASRQTYWLKYICNCSHQIITIKTWNRIQKKVGGYNSTTKSSKTISWIINKITEGGSKSTGVRK